MIKHICDAENCSEEVTTKPDAEGIMGTGETANISGISFEACCMEHLKDVIDAHIAERLEILNAAP